MGSPDPVIRLEDIGKTFPGVIALDGVGFDVFPGEVHALCGENGAGKSTLMKILSGIHPHGSYRGRILRGGDELSFHGVADAARAGIGIVHQELALQPAMTVLDNFWMGRERQCAGWLNRAAQRRLAQDHLATLSLALPLDALVGELGIGQQQRLEIARVLYDRPAVLVLDEPTSALPEDDATALLTWIRDLADKGTGCVYISHRMAEVFSIADRITVLRDGKTIWTKLSPAVDKQAVIAAMVDRPPSEIFRHHETAPGAPLMEVADLRVSRGREVVLAVPEFSVHAGEIVGLAGLMGAGRTCLLRALVGGLDHVTVAGRCRLPKANGSLGDWRPLPTDPAQAHRLGLLLIPEDRKAQALLLSESVLANTTLATVGKYHHRLGFDLVAQRESVQGHMRTFAVKAPGPDAAVGTLSGGNQQKVLLGRAADVAPRILLLDEPTRGIDVGAKADIYAQMEAWAAQGWGIVWSSSELPELLGVSDRLHVLAAGAVTAHFDQRPFDDQAVMVAATHGGEGTTA